MQPSNLPTFTARPTAAHGLGMLLGRGCLTASVLCNLCRLIALACLLIGASRVLLTGTGWLLLIGAAVAGVLGVVLRPKAAPTTALPVAPWTPAERKLMTQPDGADLTQIGIDYGTDATDQGAVIVAPDLRRAHQLVTGGSGTGKSKFVATQASQTAAVGASLFVIDPHEELASDILQAAGGWLRTKRGVVIWPDGPSAACYPWQPLHGQEPWQAADAVVAAVKRVWELSDSNTYILDVLKHTAWALAGAGWTLLEGGRFLTDPVFRQYIADTCGVPQVQQWVADFGAQNPRDQRGLTQTTLVRLNRLNANPHIQRLIGCGVTDIRYMAAARAAGITPIAGVSLLDAINAGQHVLCVLPIRALGEDQYLVAGLAQAALQTAVLRRHPNDPVAPHTEAYLDEAAAYTNAAGLGHLLAQARKFKLSATVAMQGYEQADPDLVGELKRNTAIKVLFATDHGDEAAFSAQVAFGYDPGDIKLDSRQVVRDANGRREMGRIETYSPNEQQAYYTALVTQLPPRHYLLKVRGVADARTVITPPYRGSMDVRQALAALRDRAIPVVTAAQIDAELAFRQTWLDMQRYGTQPASITPADDAAVSVPLLRATDADDLLLGV